MTAHECDDWHDGECSRCCATSGPCTGCRRFGLWHNNAGDEIRRQERLAVDVRRRGERDAS